VSCWSEIVRPSLDGHHFDVVIAGGGINGVAIAQQSARAGKRTLLVEKDDFGAGTTSRSSRVIHGGLRYLEHGEIGLVRESLRERERLLCSHPHLVRRKRFVLAIRDGSGLRSALAIRAGLWLYGKFAKSPREVILGDFEDALQSGGSVACFNYEDAQCEFPERLIAEWLVSATREGAEVRNHTEALELSVAGGKVTGIRLRDSLSGQESAVACDTVINATGPWADRFCVQAGVLTGRPMIGGVRGSHVVLPQFPGAPTDPIYSEAEDGRPIFLLPWNGQLLLGTTEVLDDGDPGDAAPSQAEIEYLFAALQRLAPQNGLGVHDLRYAFAGVRPLPYAPGQSPSKTSRSHHLIDHSDDGAQGLVSVVGGKLTTAARLARDCARAIGLKVSEPATDLCAAPSSDGICSALRQWAHQVSGVIGIPQETAFAIAQWHGADALTVTRLAASDPVWRTRICTHSPHILAEVAKAARYEKAVTIGDILLRRVPVALGPCWSAECSHEAAEKIGYALGWTLSRIDEELEQFEAERMAFLHPRGRAQTPKLSQRSGRR
jgi:glycerol-3-phosphate dehydrogenase